MLLSGSIEPRALSWLVEKIQTPTKQIQGPKKQISQQQQPSFSVSKDAQKLTYIDSKLFEKQHVKPALEQNDQIRKKL